MGLFPFEIHGGAATDFKGKQNNFYEEKKDAGFWFRAEEKCLGS